MFVGCWEVGALDLVEFVVGRIGPDFEQGDQWACDHQRRHLVRCQLAVILASVMLVLHGGLVLPQQ